MKKKVSEKFIKDSYKNILRVGYCELQTLLRCKEPKYYTAGMYGWNADIYELDYNTVIVTGYRPFGKDVKYDINKEYEEKARKINSFGLKNDYYEKLEVIFNEWLSEVN